MSQHYHVKPITPAGPSWLDRVLARVGLALQLVGLGTLIYIAARLIELQYG